MMFLYRLLVAALCFGAKAAAFNPSAKPTATTVTHLEATLGRRDAMIATATSAAFVLGLESSPLPARADVSDGNALPTAARQFSRSVQLRVDVDNVYKRLSTAKEGEIDENEWNNIGLFLRSTYQTADGDMKGVANGIYNSDNRQVALKAVDKIKKVSQASDAFARKRDATGLAGMMKQVQQAETEFFDSLSDVPDEL